MTAANFLRELGQFGFQWPQVAAVVLGTWFASIIIYGGLYLAGSDFTALQRWQVAGATVAGLVLVYLTTYFTLVVRLSSGVTVGRPLLQLLASAHAGAIAGLVIGILYVTARQDVREARRVGRQLEFMHSLLRHDVLNSMTVVRARAEHLEATLNGDHQESIEAINHQAESVIDLSQRARATVEALASDAAVTPEPVNLTEVLRSEARTVRNSHEDVTVSVGVADDVAVMGDDMLAAVFGNLLGNAVRHNDTEDPTIRIRVSVGAQTVTVRVADDGPGIPDDRKAAIFERGTSTNDGGFGLFFVRTMVEEYGGSVHVEDNERRGTVFVVELERAESLPPSPVEELAV